MEFFEWSMLNTYAGATMAVACIVEMTKALPIIARIPTQLWSYLVALATLLLAMTFDGGFTLQGASLAGAFLHDGGRLSKDKLLPILNEPVESWPRILSFSDVAIVFSNVQDASDVGAMLVDMEKVLDEYVSSVLAQAKYEAFAPENVIAFLWQKEIEAKNLRIALVSVANNTDRSIARGLLRHGR